MTKIPLIRIYLKRFFNMVKKCSEIQVKIKFCFSYLRVCFDRHESKERFFVFVWFQFHLNKDIGIFFFIFNMVFNDLGVEFDALFIGKYEHKHT